MFYDKNPIIHQYPKCPVKVQPIQVANDCIMSFKEVMEFLIPIGNYLLEIIAYLFPFSTSFEFIFGSKSRTELEGKSNYAKMEIKFRKRSTDIYPRNNIHVLACKTTAFDCEMSMKHLNLTYGPLFAKMKSKSNECLPQTLRVEMANGKTYLNLCIQKIKLLGKVT